MTKHDVLVILQRHIGAGNGVTAEQLAQQLDTETRHVRTLVTELRMDGIAVCGHPRHGYFIAASPEELQRTCDFLRSRALHSLVLESALRKMPMSELIGQLKLRT